MTTRTRPSRTSVPSPLASPRSGSPLQSSPLYPLPPHVQSPLHSPVHTPSPLAGSPMHSPSASPPPTITTPMPGTPLTGRSGYTVCTGYTGGGGGGGGGAYAGPGFSNVPRGTGGARASGAASWGVSVRGSVRSPTPGGLGREGRESSDFGAGFGLRAASPFRVVQPGMAEGKEMAAKPNSKRASASVMLEEALGDEGDDDDDESGRSSLPPQAQVAQVKVASKSVALALVPARAPVPGFRQRATERERSGTLVNTESKDMVRSGGDAEVGLGIGFGSGGGGANRESRHLTLDRTLDVDLLLVDKGPYITEDQSDAPWASYKPTVRSGSMHSLSMRPEEDSISLLRSKMYEILDDKTYRQQLYFLQCEYGKLPHTPFIPVALDGEHTAKAQALFGIGQNPTVPAFFWSSSQYFVRAVFCLAQAHCLSPAAIYAHTARIRRDMSYLGAFVGWLPLDFGVWRGKNELDPERSKYILETFPRVDEYWAFWYPVWSGDPLTKHGVTNISFGPAPSPQPRSQPLPRVETDEERERKSPVKRLSRTDKIKRRASTCHTQ